MTEKQAKRESVRHCRGRLREFETMPWEPEKRRSLEEGKKERTSTAHPDLSLIEKLEQRGPKDERKLKCPKFSLQAI